MKYEDQSVRLAPRVVLMPSPVVKAFLAGSFSGTCSTLLFQPLDLLKTRIQEAPGGRLSLVGAARQVVVTDSVTGLWRGIGPSLLRTVPGVGFYFASMHGLRTRLCQGSPTPVQSLLIGGCARTAAGMFTIPITVVKIRCESGNYNYGSTLQALRTILRVEGLRGLTAGLLPTLVRDVPFSGLYLMFYERLKRASSGLAGPDGLLNPSAAHFLSGMTAGVLASLVTQPADVIKTRQQLQPGSSIYRTAVAILRAEGPRGFLAGSVPRIMRRTMMSALAWTVYEKVMRETGLK